MSRLRRRGKLLIAILGGVLALPAWASAQQPQPSFSDAAVDQAIERGKQYLWSLYRPQGDPWPDQRTEIVQDHRGRREVPYVNYGGRMALAMYALLAAGEKYTDPRLKRGLDWLSRIDCKGTYTLGLRAQIWALLPRRIARELLVKDADRLVKSIGRPPKGTRGAAWSDLYGTYSYTSAGRPSQSADHSNTQFGILGVWAAARNGVEVPKEYWELVYKHWSITQNPEGGWNYGVAASARSKDTMTAAGLASTLVAFENLYMDKFIKCGANADVYAITQSLNWFDNNFYQPGDYDKGPLFYYLYAVERVGLASGYKYFGKKDWYKLGAVQLIRRQRGDGSWGGLVNTSFAMLFLVRGRNPVAFNRLNYRGDWNNRPRALANLTRWMSRTFERETNWQIINLQVPVEEWHDALILVISGSKAPSFTDQDLEKLRTFVHQGGRILSLAECPSQSAEFDSAMRRYYAKMFPEYKLKPLPPDHPIYRLHYQIKQDVKVWGLSNGVRILAFHANGDLPLAWQTNSHLTRADAFELAANVFLFVSDREYGRARGTSPWPSKMAFVPLRAAKVARVKYNGNWNPEPLAWERFRMLMGQKWQTNLNVGEPMTLEQLTVEEYRVAAMTGTSALSLTDGEKRALKQYVESGGTLIMDAAGGSGAFVESAAGVLEELFGQESLKRLPRSSPLYQLAGFEINSVRYRRAARVRFGSMRAPRIDAVVLNGRPAVLLSKDDLTAGLVGYPCYTCVGYSPESAAELMRNMVLTGVRVQKRLAAPGPSTQAAE